MSGKQLAPRYGHEMMHYQVHMSPDGQALNRKAIQRNPQYGGKPAPDDAQLTKRVNSISGKRQAPDRRLLTNITQAFNSDYLLINTV